MTIQTETDHSGTDLNDVIGVLHKQIDRGYISPTQVYTLANLITSARENAVRDWAFQKMRDMADRADGKRPVRSSPPPHDHEWTKVGGPGDEWRVCFLCDAEDDE